MRYKAPDTSFTDTSHPSQQNVTKPQKVARAKVATVQNVVSTSRTKLSPLRKAPERDKKKDAAREAFVRHEIKKRVKSRVAGLIRTWVYLGNLQPFITEEHIRHHFSTCGIILDVTIRNSGSPVHGENYYYASVLFNTFEAADRAVLLKDKIICGREILVTMHLIELPEVQMYQTLHPNYKPKVAPAPSQKPKTKPLGCAKTEVWPVSAPAPAPSAASVQSGRPAKNDRNVVGDVSFSKTLV
ncbi:hypothetical protein B0H10DRAFT_2045632 [Mycena sp. CBHHK59/15]|nr:hypothetical protein B0H10DRAFT_2045632 [Mycena sp. CBHHK59/15]